MKAKLVTRRHTCGGKQQASMMICTLDNSRSKRSGLLGWHSAVRRAATAAAIHAAPSLAAQGARRTSGKSLKVRLQLWNICFSGRMPM